MQRPQSRGRALRVRCLLPVALIAWLAACATPASFAPGATEAQLQAKLGAADRVYASPDGGKRLEYARGAFEQFVWMVDVDASGRVVAINQVRTFENFGRLRPGVDDQKSVLREFGAPWKVERYALSKLTGWLYPYREAGVFNSVMTVMFDEAGVFRRAENGPDPRFIVNDGHQRQ